MFSIIRYTADKVDEWNQFVAQSKNGTFLFDRRYMDYHADRFEDYSLMVYHKNHLYALLPANRRDDVLYTHQGLTYGGLLMSKQCTTALVRNLFGQLNAYLHNQGVLKVVYKPVPWIYHRLPSEEDLYALCNACHARLISRDVASVVMLNRRLPLSQLRRRGVKKAAKAGVRVAEQNDFAPFWYVLERNLMMRHHTQPVHSLNEITLLKSRFPQNIRLFTACCGDEIVGGTVLYIDRDVVKTQYISASERGREIGALDELFSSLLNRFADEGYTYFDFGTSNMPGSDDLHDSLIFQKEGFGARAVCYDTYEWTL